MKPIIVVAGLSKEYTLGRRQAPYSTLREDIVGALRSPFRTIFGQPREGAEKMWALRDVTFSVAPGEAVGIIGRNGAGKSTLLKLLSRITEPSTGRAELYGRVASLLEVGTGFHPELTGRENIFLNGAILGMRRQEVRRNFDEIVSFAEIERFLDTPVKYYSSGMYTRLAFSVAAHLEPEILVVDEVLAVGDAAFQRKCLGKMRDVRKHGRTVLFVSHNMAAVRTLCTRAVVLDRGMMVADERPPAKAIAAYAGLVPSDGTTWVRQGASVGAVPPIVFNSIAASLHGRQPSHLLRVIAELVSQRAHAPAFVAFDILDSMAAPICQALPAVEPFIEFSPSGLRITVDIQLPPLIPGSYSIRAWAGPHYTETYDSVTGGPSFTITEGPTPNRTFPHTPDHGAVVPLSSVMCERLAHEAI